MNELREKLKLTSVQEHIKLCHLRWYGHLTRMSNDHWPKIILKYKVAGLYPKGCPKKRWLDNLNNSMRSQKINAELAFDRHKWRKATQKKTYSLDVSNPRKQKRRDRKHVSDKVRKGID